MTSFITLYFTVFLIYFFRLTSNFVFTGEGHGPRYCPSLDRKVVKFPDRTRHQIWLELETDDFNGIVYPNGISMSLDPEIQQEIVNTISGKQKK